MCRSAGYYYREILKMNAVVIEAPRRRGRPPRDPSPTYHFEETNVGKIFAPGVRVRTDSGREGRVVASGPTVVTVEYDADRRGVEQPVTLGIDLARRLWVIL